MKWLLRFCCGVSSFVYAYRNFQAQTADDNLQTQVFKSLSRHMQYTFSGSYWFHFAHPYIDTDDIVGDCRTRGLRNSTSRQCMVAIILIMIASTTSLVITNLEGYIMQLPTIGLPDDPVIIRQVTAYAVGKAWMTRLNVRLH